MIELPGEASQLAGPRLLLAGGGHSHARLLLLWARHPRLRPAAAITLVSRCGESLYSGMLPAVVAGLQHRQRCVIDLHHLCQRVGVRLVEAEIEGLDPICRSLRLRDRPPLAYELLSLDVGAVSDRRGIPLPEAMAVKPLEPFLAWCERLEAGRLLRLRGGGAAALELALAFRQRGCRCVLQLRGERLHLGSAAANRAGERLLRRAGIAVERRVPPEAPCELLCTGSQAPAWLASAGLPVDPGSGRVLSGADLRVCGHRALFVSGDCGLIHSAPRPPAGVWAVRAAPLLACNLRRCLLDPAAPLRRWRPQRWALQLIADASTATAPDLDGGEPGCEALALWGPFVLGPSLWLGRWKQRIDRRFLAGFASCATAAEPAAPLI